MTSRGSMTFPRDLLILRPWASRTMAWRYTWGQGGTGDTRGQDRDTPGGVPGEIWGYFGVFQGHFGVFWAPPRGRAAARSAPAPASPSWPPRRRECRVRSPAATPGRTAPGRGSGGTPKMRPGSPKPPQDPPKAPELPLTGSGHPKMEKGKRPEENQVSRTSSSEQGQQ